MFYFGNYLCFMVFNIFFKNSKFGCNIFVFGDMGMP